MRAAGAAGACLAGGAGARAADGKRPNIFIVMADDQNWLDAGCYGNPDVRTPNIDRLAAAGMRFDRCFTATAMCAPTRQQLYTGIFPVRSGAYPNHSRVYDGTKSIVHYLRDRGYRVGLCGKKHFGPRESFPFENVRKNQLRSFVAGGDPWCLVYTSNSPHCPWSAGHAGRYDPEKITIPAYMIDTPETRRALCRYYAEVTDFDREVGECMDVVDGAAAAENTIFIYTSEQGMQAPFAKWTCYDLGLRTALVVRWPRQVKAGSTTTAMVQYVDVVPTLVEAAGGTVPGGLDGRSFLGVLRGRRDTFREYVYGVHTNLGIIAGKPYPVRSVRTEQYKYIRNLNHEGEYVNVMLKGDREKFVHSWLEKAKSDPAAKKRVDQYLHRPAEELYDVEKDPFELNNLAGKPGYADVIGRLRGKLDEWMAQQGDRGMETELKAKSRQGRGKKGNKKKKRRNT